MVPALLTETPVAGTPPRVIPVVPPSDVPATTMVVPLTTAPVITGWVCAETVGDGKRMNTRAIARPTPQTRLQENGRTRPPFDTALLIKIL
jgi:hypothetical protein